MSTGVVSAPTVHPRCFTMFDPVIKLGIQGLRLRIQGSGFQCRVWGGVGAVKREGLKTRVCLRCGTCKPGCGPRPGDNKWTIYRVYDSFTLHRRGRVALRHAAWSTLPALSGPLSRELAPFPAGAVLGRSAKDAIRAGLKIPE